MSENQELQNKVYGSEFWHNAKSLTSQIMEYLPREEISEISVFHYVLNYFRFKEIAYSWTYEVDCYLGIPRHIEKLNDLKKVKYGTFPLEVIRHLYIESPFSFALLREECIDGITLNGSTHLMHFTYSEFLESNQNFEERVEEGNLHAYRHFSDERGFYMQDENLDEKLKNDEVEYAYYYKETFLNEEYYLRLNSLRTEIFSSSLRLYFELSSGLSYQILGLDEDNEDKINEIHAAFLTWDFIDFHKFLLERNEDHINYLFSKIESFLANLHPYYEQLCEFLEEEPDNHIIETEIEMIEHLAKNTDAKWLKEILGETFKRN